MCTVSHVGICEECVSMDANLRFLHSLGSVFLQVVSSSDSMFDSYMGFFVGAAFLYSVSHVKCYASCAFFLKLHIRAHTGAYRPLFKRRHTTCTRITSSYKPWRRASLPYHPLRFTRWQPCKALLALNWVPLPCFTYTSCTTRPSVDPVAGLSHHVVEAGTLCTAAIVVFGVVGLAERV